MYTMLTPWKALKMQVTKALFFILIADLQRNFHQDGEQCFFIGKPR